jgi:hypothetical protein
MIVNTTTLKIDPARLVEFTDLLYSPETIQMGKTSGIRDAVLLHSIDQPGLLVSGSMFDTQEQADKLFTSPFYAGLVKELMPFLLAAPTRMRLDLVVQRKFKERLPHMHVNDTIIKIDPARLDEFVKVLWSSDVLEQMLPFDVFIEGFTLHSLENPGTIHSISFYASPEDAKVIFSNPDYAALLGKLKPFFTAAPERLTYTLVRTEDIPYAAPVA